MTVDGSPRAHADPRSTSTPGAGAARTWSGLVVALERNTLLVLLAAVIVFFSTWPTTATSFSSTANITGVLGDQSVTALMALAALAPLIVGEFDFSIGQLVTFLAVLNAALLTTHGWSLWVSVPVTVAVAVAIGLGTGLLVAKLQVSSLVITLATGTVMGGVVLYYTEGLAIVVDFTSPLIEFGRSSAWSVPYTAVGLVVVVLLAWHLVERTPAGRNLRFVGSNREAARLVGVRVDRTIVATFVASAVLSALAAIVLTARNGAANPGDGPGLLFPAIAAAFLGATTVRPGQFNVLGTIIGVFFVAVSVSGLNLAGVAPWVQPVFYGVSLAVAVLMSTLLARRRARLP